MKNITLKQVIKEFEINLRMKGKAENTVIKYVPATKMILEEYFGKSSNEILISDIHITHKEFNKFFNALRVEKKWKESTGNIKLSSIREFSIFIKNEYDVLIDCTTTDNMKIKRNKVVYMNKQETMDFWNVIENESFYTRDKDFKNKKLKATISLMLFGGLRSCEVKGLKPTDIIIENGKCIINIRNEISKGGVFRKTAIASKGGNKAILEYIEAREQRLEKLNVKSDIFIFGDRYDHTITQPTLVEMTERVLEKIQIEGITPHKLRHTFACLSYDNSQDLYLTMELLGHTDVRTTQIYAKNLEMDKKLRSLDFGI